MQPDTLDVALAAPEGHSELTSRQARRARKKEGRRSAGEWRRDRARRRRIRERADADGTLTDLEQRVLGVLMDMSDDSAKPVFPSMLLVGIPAHCDRRSARRCIAQLEAAGYLKRWLRPQGRRRNATNLYYFCELSGAPPEHREGQRRRPRKRCSHRGTRESQETGAFDRSTAT